MYLATRFRACLPYELKCTCRRVYHSWSFLFSWYRLREPFNRDGSRIVTCRGEEIVGCSSITYPEPTALVFSRYDTRLHVRGWAFPCSASRPVHLDEEGAHFEMPCLTIRYKLRGSDPILFRLAKCCPSIIEHGETKGRQITMGTWPPGVLISDTGFPEKCRWSLVDPYIPRNCGRKQQARKSNDPMLCQVSQWWIPCPVFSCLRSRAMRTTLQNSTLSPSGVPQG